MATVNPSQEELRKVLQETPKDQPVVMLNLLRFRDQAAYKDDTENCSGRDAYKRYMDEAAECVRSVGAEVIWSGRSRSEEHTSELQSRPHLVCRLLLEK